MLIAGRYRLLDLVGRGGMGRVWRARDEMLHREVAVKEVVPPGWLADHERAELRSRTLREARTAARLNHPAVVRLYDVVPVEGSPWIVMEYVPSRTLQDVLDAEGPLEPTRAARIGLALLGALHAAHTAGVLHRDIKPQNVLMAHDGRVMLTDFGLATFDGGDGAMTRPGMVLGSPQYVAPERAAEGVSTVAADLWSLGATLHAAVEGRSPYARSTAMATLSALAAGPRDPAPHAGPLAPVLAGLLRRDPHDRLDHDAARRLLTAAADGRTDPALTSGGANPLLASGGANPLAASGPDGPADGNRAAAADGLADDLVDQDPTIPLPEPGEPAADPGGPVSTTPPDRRRTARRAALIAVALLVAAAAGVGTALAVTGDEPSDTAGWPTAAVRVCPSGCRRRAGAGRRTAPGRGVPAAARLGLARRHHRLPGLRPGDLALLPGRRGGLLPGPDDRPGLQRRPGRQRRPAGPATRGPRRCGRRRSTAGVRRDPARRQRRWRGVGVPLGGPERPVAARPATGRRGRPLDAGLDHRRQGLEPGRHRLAGSPKQFPTTPLTCTVWP
ncbi:serine/threonine-protein kinase [Micromonospora sp. ALFpr18c]|uniref:serine/threonine-protein kinase n=1 Tax=Micromonospora sp. ALFpr18c TaxID=1458665 RepID=UPI001CEC81AD|nr:serine/threonine-protein kinase [Micromonospora sp. ALFpr18c]